MKFVACLCLIISVTQLSTADNPAQGTQPIQKRFTVHLEDIEIPENSWWNVIHAPEHSWLERIELAGISLWQRIFTRHNPTIKDTLPFSKIVYNQTIPKDSPIRVDYTVQYGNDRNEWINMTTDSVYLCDPNPPDSERTSILALVRELLCIYEGCPVLAGEKRDTSSIHLPLVGRTLFFDGGRIEPKMRIVTNIWEGFTADAKKLLSAKFYLETKSER